MTPVQYESLDRLKASGLVAKLNSTVKRQFQMEDAYRTPGPQVYAEDLITTKNTYIKPLSKQRSFLDPSKNTIPQ